MTGNTSNTMKIAAGTGSLLLIAVLFYFLGMNQNPMSTTRLEPASGLNLAANNKAGSGAVHPAGARAPVVLSKDFGDWLLECRQAEKGPKQCLMLQRHVKEVKGKKLPLLSAVVMLVPRAPAKEGEDKVMAVPALRLITPMAAFLPGGVAAQVDEATEDKDKMKMGYLTCSPAGCIAETLIKKETMDDMRKGKELPVTFALAGPAKPVPVKVNVSLKGFSAGFDALVKEMGGEG